MKKGRCRNPIRFQTDHGTSIQQYKKPEVVVCEQKVSLNIKVLVNLVLTLMANVEHVRLYCNLCSQDKPVKNIHEMQFRVKLSNQPHNSSVAAKTGPACTNKDQEHFHFPHIIIKILLIYSNVQIFHENQHWTFYKLSKDKWEKKKKKKALQTIQNESQRIK